MADIKRIIIAIDFYLERKHQTTTTPVEINPYLETKGLLNDSKSRPGLPVRKLLRKGQIPHTYQVGVNWHIPHSKETSANLEPIFVSKSTKGKKINNESSTCNHKLGPIGELIINLLEKKHGIIPKLIYEYKPDWLLSNPSKNLINNYPELSKLYSELTNDKYTLTEKHSELTEKNLMQKQSFDIWIGEPFNFAIEFDEKQHFNQFRKITLDYYEKVNTKFPLNVYKQLNDGIKIKPGKSGFTKLKGYDPLFPEMLEGEKQDNRIKQRAFRDFLKDLLPIEHGFNPTLRIPFQVTNKNIDNFDKSDIDNVEKYINNNRLL